ncbi:MFS allantoate transporter [Talaromyces pinophilus]|uniref:MFS allantoate transporter n=1 Tax=Talaromyces pinophilus TaxID=128442 RepID=A0A6V8HA63_TALPI|nr:MFS allantoate transporter [Talaromyces pinophilus]
MEAPTDSPSGKVKDEAISQTWMENMTGAEDDGENQAKPAESVVLEWTEDEEKRLLRKIDTWLLPLLLFSGFFTLMDAQALGTAALFGFVEDLGLYSIKSLAPLKITTVQYSWVAAITYYGVLASQYPLLALAQKVPIGKFQGVVIFYCGMCSLLMIVLTNFSGAMALRFFFGFHVVLSPLHILVTGMWWRSEEQPTRIGVWSCGASLGSVAGQAMNYGLVHLGGPFAASPWKYIYLVLGCITMSFGILFSIFFPDSPKKARFLTEREKLIAVERLRENNIGITNRKFKWLQARAAMLDYTVWLLGANMFVIALSNAAIQSYGGLIIKAMGFTNFKAIEMAMPASAISVVVMLSSGIIGRRFHGHRCLIGLLFLLPGIAGFTMLWKAPRTNQSALLAGLYIVSLRGFLTLPKNGVFINRDVQAVFYYGAYIQNLGLLSANLAGHTKRTTANALCFGLSAIGSICGPFAFKGEEANIGYPTGMITILSLLATSAGIFLILWLSYHFENKRRDKEGRLNREAEAGGDNAFLDLTDTENRQFRYCT